MIAAEGAAADVGGRSFGGGREEAPYALALRNGASSVAGLLRCRYHCLATAPRCGVGGGIAGLEKDGEGVEAAPMPISSSDFAQFLYAQLGYASRQQWQCPFCAYDRFHMNVQASDLVADLMVSV